MGIEFSSKKKVVNTGDAAVTDVALGKTFSSAMLTNATGTSTKNATVPTDVPILPVQVFVNTLVAHIVERGLGQVLNFAAKGITSIDIATIDLGAGNGFNSVVLTDNALDVFSVNSSLSYLVATGIHDGYSDFSGGTNAAPTGQGLTDKATLESRGWTVTTN